MSTETTIKNETASGSVPGKLTPRIHVSVSPHVHSGASTTAIMRDVALALLRYGCVRLRLAGTGCDRRLHRVLRAD